MESQSCLLHKRYVVISHEKTVRGREGGIFLNGESVCVYMSARMFMYVCVCVCVCVCV